MFEEIRSNTAYIAAYIFWLSQISSRIDFKKPYEESSEADMAENKWLWMDPLNSKNYSKKLKSKKQEKSAKNGFGQSKMPVTVTLYSMKNVWVKLLEAGWSFNFSKYAKGRILMKKNMKSLKNWYLKSQAFFPLWRNSWKSAEGWFPATLTPSCHTIRASWERRRNGVASFSEISTPLTALPEAWRSYYYCQRPAKKWNTEPEAQGFVSLLLSPIDCQTTRRPGRVRPGRPPYQFVLNQKRQKVANGCCKSRCTLPLRNNLFWMNFTHRSRHIHPKHFHSPLSFFPLSHLFCLWKTFSFTWKLRGKSLKKCFLENCPLKEKNKQNFGENEWL